MKRLLIVFALFLSSYCIGQSISADTIKSNKKFFVAYEFSILSNYLSSQAIAYPTYIGAGNSITGTGVGGTWLTAYEIINFGVLIRYNINEFSENTSVSASITPTIGSGLNGAGGSGDILFSSDGSALEGITFSLPLLAEYNYGTIATGKSAKRLGFMVGFGIEVNGIFPFGNTVAFYTIQPNTVVYIHYNPVWIEPAAKMAFRYINKRQREKEISVKGGFGGPHSFVDGQGNPYIYRSFSLKLSMAWYLK